MSMTQTINGKYTVTQTQSGYRLTWIENQTWNTLFTAEFSRIALIINRIK